MSDIVFTAKAEAVFDGYAGVVVAETGGRGMVRRRHELSRSPGPYPSKGAAVDAARDAFLERLAARLADENAPAVMPGPTPVPVPSWSRSCSTRLAGDGLMHVTVQHFQEGERLALDVRGQRVAWLAEGRYLESTKPGATLANILEPPRSRYGTRDGPGAWTAPEVDELRDWVAGVAKIADRADAAHVATWPDGDIALVFFLS